MDNKEKVLKKLDELDINYKIINHPPVYTIAEVINLNLENQEDMVKNLFLKNSNGKTHYLVVLQGNKKVDLKSLRNQLNSSSLSFASEERLKKHLNLLKGAVTPLGIINDEDHSIKVVLDKDLKEQNLIGIHPNVNTSTVWITYKDLEKFIKEFNNEVFYVNI